MEVVLYLLIFLLVYFIYYYFVVNKKNKLEKFKESMEMKYLSLRYQLEVEKLPMPKTAKLIALTNAFIITIVLIIMDFFEYFLLKIGVAFVSLIILQLMMYHILGRYLQRGEKNEPKRN